MKLNIYSFLFFGLILIFLYPLIFYFSEKRINTSNNRLTSYEYNIRGFLSVNNLSRSSSETSNATKIINKEYFEDKTIIKFEPKEKFSISESYTMGSLDGDINLLFDSDINLLPTNNLSVIKNNEVILLLGDVVIFYYDLRYIYNFINEELTKSKSLKNNFSQNCGLIKQNLVTMRKINHSVYEFDFSIKQKFISTDNELLNQNDIISIYENCLTKKLDIIAANLKTHLKNFEKIQIDDFEKGFITFLDNEKEFIFDENESKKLKESIYEVKKRLTTNLFDIDFDLEFIQTSDIEISQKYQKNFNMYVISFIISFLFTLIIFYVLFFLKNNIKIFKKIF